ncbi:hypothetical protein PIB30_092664 [Stylosanthes scabra]|uniref:Uncharacterized protein n=1 Tax=Stylosanthes scabra TaxID=79078 RepID=A0ABU6UXD9_9FABA|nr:hypothetical protein [Stylosanthes scabra]
MEKEFNVGENSHRSPELGLWDSRSNLWGMIIFSSLWATYSWPYSLKIGPRGWSVTLPPLGSLSASDQAFEVVIFEIYETVPSLTCPLGAQSAFKKLLGTQETFFLRPTSLLSETLLSSVYAFRFLDFLASFDESPFHFRKKSCQNVRVPRVLSAAERDLYGWVDDEIFTQPSVVEDDSLLEPRHEMRLRADRAAKGDFVLEVADPSDRLPFRAQEDMTHFLEVLTRCQVAASQLHLNGWGFLRTFERGRKLFDSFEESIQEFKWHYFKVLPLPGRWPFWLDDQGMPFSWVYWNSEVGDFRVTTLDPLETLVFEFLQSLPVGLGKKSNFKCHWILDHSDAEVGVFLDSLLKDMEKQSRFDRLMQKMKEVEGACPRSILPSSRAQSATSGPLVSDPVALASTPSATVPLVPPSDAVKARKKPLIASSGKPFSVEVEEGVKEDPSADLRQKKRKQKVSEASAEEAALGVDSVWEHEVNAIDRAFPADYNFREALDTRLMNGPILEILGPLVPEQLLGIAQYLTYKLTACLQVGVENPFAAKVQMEKDLAATRDQVDVLTAERDSALATPLLYAKIKSLSQELELTEGERLSALDRMKEVEERAKVQAAELESCCSALEQERKKVESLTQSLKGKQTALVEAEAAVVHWRDEWKSLAEETGEMV